MSELPFAGRRALVRAAVRPARGPEALAAPRIPTSVRALPGSGSAPVSSAVAAPQHRLRIDALRVALPGVTAASARRIVARALELASQRLPSGLSGSIDALKLQIRPKGHSEAALSEAIAGALVEALQRGR